MPVQKKTVPPENLAARRLLVIDDDAELCELLAEYLQPEGFRVDALHNGIHAAEKALSEDYSLIVLDVMLPGLRGFEVLQRIRATSRIPVIMLTARGEDVDRILGLEIGADDYLPKPFNPRELAARIHAVLRRTSGSTPLDTRLDTGEQPLILGDLELYPASRVAFRGGQELELTSVEFDLLRTFLASVGVVIQRERLAREVLGRELAPLDRSIDVHVSNLRRKLGSTPEGSERIKAIRSVGYLYAAPTKGKAR
jgi:DNA-binding response OmpR family regulator